MLKTLWLKNRIFERVNISLEIELTNRYFELPLKKQKLFQLKLGIYTLLVIMLIDLILFLIDLQLLLLLPILIGIIITLIAPFYDIPSLVESGKLKYFSLFLLAEEEKKGVIKIHGGSLFDYYFVFSKQVTGQERTRIVILEYLKGLKKLIHEENEDKIIEGTSYIINERTANKVGLQKVSTNTIQMILLAFNYFNLMVSLYLTKKTIKLPGLNKTNTFRARVKDVKKREYFIDQLILKLMQPN